MATYETDFHAWTGEQAELLHRGKWEQLDVENLAEELESLGKQERRELTHRLGILLGHLLKSENQCDQRSNNWLATMEFGGYS